MIGTFYFGWVYLPKKPKVRHLQENKLVGCIGVSSHFNSQGHIMAVGEAHLFPGFLILVINTTFSPKPPTNFLICFSRGERWKYSGKKVCLNLVLNSQPPSHESDMLTTGLPRQGYMKMKIVVCKLFQFGSVQNLLIGKGLPSAILGHHSPLCPIQLHS